MENNKISVIVPVYNVQSYIDDCIESIVNQTYNNIEIILVNDGSTDESALKCEDWAKRDKRIRVVQKVNEGLNFARRDGLKASTGEFISFVDSDDVIAKDFLKTLMTVIERNNVDISIAGFSKFKKIFNVDKISKIGSQDVVIEKNKHRIMEWLINWDFPWNENIYIMTAWGRLYRRSALDNVDWEFSNYRANEDEFWTMQIFNNIDNGIAIIGRQLYGYRDNPKSITRHTNYVNFYNDKPMNKFQFIEHLYKKSFGYLGNYYKKMLLRRMATNMVDFIDIYIDNNMMNIANIITAQRLIMIYGKSMFKSSSDPRVLRKLKRMMMTGVPGYVIIRKINSSYTD